MNTPLRLHIARQDLRQAHLAPDPDNPAARPLAEGQARLQIEHFALTANNLTYAAFGEAMKYWQFFPAADAAWGCLPVWGFARVVESRSEGVAVGQRVYGCLPAGTHLVVQPQRVSSYGFQDGSAHRQGLAVVYAKYEFCTPETSDRHAEGLRAVLQPLFVTSFLIDDFLAEQAFFGARQVLLSSASSKTALGTAWCLAQRRGQSGAPRALGLTAPANLGFTQALNVYDEVLPYDALARLDPTVPTVYVDMAGNAALRRAVHEHFAGTLVYSCSVGGTHWQALGSGSRLPGPRPTLFFAPAQMQARHAAPPQGWGPGGLQQRLGQAWAGFVQALQRPGEVGLSIVQRPGSDALLAAYAAMAVGQVSPGEGLMLSLQGGA
jgi:Protein of unknown function (DUF2855)